MLVGRAEGGTRVVYIPGNHDDAAREVRGHEHLRRRIRRQLVTALRTAAVPDPGDDSTRPSAAALPSLGAASTSGALREQRSSIARAGSSGSGLVADGMAQAIRSRRAHLHRALRGSRSGVPLRSETATASSAATSITRRSARSTACLYCNDGDWVENCTSLVETMSGRLALCAGPIPAPSGAQRPLRLLGSSKA
jgi:hypothetical protein